MSDTEAAQGFSGPRRLPRGRHALAPEQVLADQRERLLDAVPAVVAERGYEAMTVADLVKRAAVSRNAFYKNFSDKQDCFAAACEAWQQRLLRIVELPCDKRATLEERVENSLAAALEALSAEPAVARLLVVEAPSAGEEIALGHHRWLQRYGDLLRSLAPAGSRASTLPLEIDQVIVGGISSRIASEVLQGRGADLRELTPQLVDYVLAFYGSSRPAPGNAHFTGPGPAPAPGYLEAPRRKTGS